VLDCSLALAWLLREREGTAAVDILEQVFINGGIGPSIWRLEILNGVLSALQQRRIKPDQVDRVLAQAAEIPIELDRGAEHLAWTRVKALAIKHRLSAYDAAYLDLSMRHDGVLGTLDKKLADAARTEGVMVVPALPAS
jgi:predicted nucleic acid-binding protein